MCVVDCRLGKVAIVSMTAHAASTTRKAIGQPLPLSEPHSPDPGTASAPAPAQQAGSRPQTSGANRKIALESGAESACAQGGDDGNEPVDHDRQALARRAQKHARHCAQIEAADFGQNVNRVVGVRLMKRERVRDDLFFSSETPRRSSRRRDR